MGGHEIESVSESGNFNCWFVVCGSDGVCCDFDLFSYYIWFKEFAVTSESDADNAQYYEYKCFHGGKDIKLFWNRLEELMIVCKNTKKWKNFEPVPWFETTCFYFCIDLWQKDSKIENKLYLCLN